MSFKKKLAWIAAITTILVWGGYLGLLFAAVRGHVAGPSYIIGVTGAVVIQTFLMIVAGSVTTMVSHRNADDGGDQHAPAMPFKEKIAWISVLTTILVWGGYFGFFAATGGRMPGPVYIVGFAGAVIIQTMLVVVASVVTAVLAPKDASAGSDERDKAIARGAYAVAYPVLLTLIVCVAASMHLGVTPRDMTYEIMGAIVIAEIVHYGAQIVGYRSGRHG